MMNKNDINTIITLYGISLIFILLSYFFYTDIFMLFPFIAVYVLYKKKYQNFKKWVFLGSIAIILMSLTIWAFYPMNYNEIYHDLSSPSYVGNQSLIQNFTYVTVNNQFYDIFIKSNKNLTYNISIVEYLTNGSNKYILNTSGISKFNQSYYYINLHLNVSGFYKDIYLTNISLKNGTNKLTIYIFEPVMYTKQQFESVLQNYTISMTMSIFLYILIFSEFLFILIGFGIYMLLKGRKVISEMTQNQQNSKPP
ncbi:MAG: hypothetical protein ACP5RZ_04465 [Thermoplasmata archaeon]